MELVLKTSEQQCFVGSNPTASAIFSVNQLSLQGQNPDPSIDLRSNSSKGRKAAIVRSITKLCHQKSGQTPHRS
jgi:hypothetical protein